MRAWGRESGGWGEFERGEPHVRACLSVKKNVVPERSGVEKIKSVCMVVVERVE